MLTGAGYGVLRAYSGTEALMLPERRNKIDLLLGGAANYLTKSFDTGELLARIIQDAPACTEGSLKIHVSNLRKNLRKKSGRAYIEAVWGIGFKLRQE